MSTSILVPLGTWLLKKSADKTFELISQGIIKEDQINNKFEQALGRASANLQSKYPEILGGSIQYFFSDEKIFNELYKLLFINANIDLSIIETTLDITTLPKDFVLDFIKELKNELNKDLEINSILSNKELFVITQGFSQDVKQIASASSLTVEELIKIRKILEEKFNKNFSVSKFLELYKSVALRVLSQVNFLGLGIEMNIQKGKRKRLNDIFVKPRIALTKDRDAELFEDYIEDLESNFLAERKAGIINYRNLFSTSANLVILGKPGAGKSTLIKSIICSILNNDSSQFEDTDIFIYIPFRIELRNYLSFKKEEDKGILAYILSLLEKEYSINNITTENLQDLLTLHHVILFFDGLDEIFNVQDKLSVKDDIENIHDVYPNIRSVTTSRIIGYEEAKLDDEKFIELQILNFNEEQIIEYVRKWYQKEEDDEEIRNREIKGFLDRKHEIDFELISNPLLLSLIVILYKNNLKLPESKLEIYESCTKTLVEKWDSSKELKIELDAEINKRKEALFADLAFWQYEQLSKGEKITFESARKTIQKSIEVKLKKEDSTEAEKLSYQFMEYAQKRSLYFENSFTHKTFLEYFCAFWIYSNYELKHKSEERNSLITKHVSESFWFIVLELLLNMIDKHQADNDIMDGIISLQIDSSSESLPFLLNIIPNLKNAGKEKCIDMSIKYLLDNEKSSKNFSTENLTTKIFLAFRNLAFRDKSYTSNLFEKIINIQSGNYSKSEIENSFVLFYELEDSMFRRSIESKDILMQLVKSLKSELYNSALQTNPYLYILDYFSNNDENFYYYMAHEKNNFFHVLIERFGKKAFFSKWNAYFANYQMGSIVHSFIYCYTLPQNTSLLEKEIEYLKQKGIDFRALYNLIITEEVSIELDDQKLSNMLNYINESDNGEVNCIFALVLCLSIMHGRNRHLMDIFNNGIIYNKHQKILRIALNESENGAIQKIYDYFINGIEPIEL